MGHLVCCHKSCYCMADVEVELTDAEFRVLEGDLHAPVCAYLRGATEKSVVVNTTSPCTLGTRTHTQTYYLVSSTTPATKYHYSFFLY